MKRIDLFCYPVFLIFAWILSACGWNEAKGNFKFYDIADREISPEEVFSFRPFELNPNQSSDTIAMNDRYKVNLIVRYTDNCKIKGVPLEVEMTSMKMDSVFSCHLEVPLFDNEDNALGKGSYGVFETEQTIPFNPIFDPDLEITVSPTQEIPSGIISLGIATFLTKDN